MSNRAEEAAWKWATENKLDPYSMGRAYAEGFEQAEKDLIEMANSYLKEPLHSDDLLPAACFLAGQISEALTWEDVKLICDLKMELALDDDLPPRSQELYEAVLRAFKQRKEEQK